MRRETTLRAQLLVRVLAVVALLIMVLGVTQYALLGRYLQQRAADALHLQVRTALTTAQAGLEPLDAPMLVRALASPNTSVRILDAQGDELAAAGPVAHDLTFTPAASDRGGDAQAALATGYGPGPGPRQGPGPGREARVQVIRGERWLVVFAFVRPEALATPDGPGIVLVAQSLREQDAILRFLAWLTTLGGAAGLALAAFLSWHLMGGALRPLTLLAEAAGAISGGDWERRVEPGSSREINEAATAFNRMVDRLQEAFAAEKEQQERMRSFLADAAHELRTPLTALNGFVEVMQAGAVGDPETHRRALAAMHSEGERMARLIRDLLQIARLDRPDHGALPMADLDLGELLRGLQPALSAADPAHPIDLQVGGPALIHGNADGLKQVVWNLVDNARRYSPPDREVTITCRSAGDQVLLAVSDKGTGIPPEDLPRVFERFRRGDASRQRATGGTGLGLSIVEALVLAHGGQIRLESEVGRGTTVELQLPRISPSPVEP